MVGFFYYFGKRMWSFWLNQCCQTVNNGGSIITSNYSLDGHHYRTFLEYAFEWYIIYRNKGQLEQLGKMVKQPCTVAVDEDPSGVIKYLDVNIGEQK